MNPALVIIAVAIFVVIVLCVLFAIRILSGVAFAALAILVGIVAGLAAIKASQIKILMSQKWSMPSTPVTTAAVTEQTWVPTLSAVGSLSAVQGVMVSAQLDGNVTRIAFQAGGRAKAGDLLVQQDITTETAELHAAEAAAKLAAVNLKRSRELLANNTISQSQLDTDSAASLQALAQEENIRSAIDKKTIRAPFSGRLGIRLVNLGQTLKAGDPIVSLQALDPIYADFYLPQQDVSQVSRGATVQIATDALPGTIIAGKVTAINPDVDSATRNVRIEATLRNPDERLRPGMYVTADVLLPTHHTVLVVPATAILYAPYGDSVFVVEDGKMGKAVRQQFVRLGEKRGDFVAVTTGLRAGQVVVSTGTFKLRNGVPVTVDNSLAPTFKLAPTPDDS